MTPPRPDAPPGLLRFDRAVRWVHWSVAGLVLVLVVTAAVLYNGSLAVLVGDRRAVEQVHVWSGLALPVPLLLGLLSRAYRDDLRRLDRFTADDRRWLRSRTRRDGTIAVGKYNAGQKLNASLSAAGLGALLLTGVVMWRTGLAPLAWRTGATWVHDWVSLCVGLLVLGHTAKALRDPGAMLGMRTGRVTRPWARREHAAWAAEVDG